MPGLSPSHANCTVSQTRIAGLSWKVTYKHPLEYVYNIDMAIASQSTKVSAKVRFYQSITIKSTLTIYYCSLRPLDVDCQSVPTTWDPLHVLMMSSCWQTQSLIFRPRWILCTATLHVSVTTSTRINPSASRLVMKFPPSVKLNDKEVIPTESLTHLGIDRYANDPSPDASIDDRLSLGRRSAYALMGSGFHGMNGISPAISIHIYRTYVLPRVLYGLEGPS